MKQILQKPVPILIVLLVVLAGLVVLNNVRREKRYAVEPALPKQTLESAEAFILQKGAQRTVLAKKDQSWLVDGGPWPVKMSRLERLREDLGNLTRSEVVSTRQDREAQYGLDSAQVARIGVVHGTETTWVWIGKPDATFSGVYFRMADANQVYRSPGVIWVDAESRGWKEGKLWSVGQHQLRAVTYAYKDSVRSWNNADTTAAARSKWNDISSKAVALEADEFYDARPEVTDSLKARLSLVLDNGDSLVADIIGGHAGRSVLQHANGQWVGVSSWKFAPFTAQ